METNTKPTHEQAQLHLQVYDLRREARLRQARDWFFKNYHVPNFDDSMRIVDVAAMRLDFVIGGSYKYLRGGPGACFLYLSPEILAGGLRPLDTGWFARENTFGYQRPDPPLLRGGGDAFLESTPPVLTYYQARSGQQFILAMGVDRLCDYARRQLQQLKCYLADAGIDAIGGDAGHGAFLAVRHARAGDLANKIAESNVIANARGEWLRLCPDCCIRDEELQTAASVLRKALE